MKDNTVNILIDTMMEMCGYNARTEHLKTLGKMGCAWYHEYTCTPKEAMLFKTFAVPFIRRQFKYMTNKRAEMLYQLFWLNYGLREIGTEIDDNKE